jgi:O-antigen/teichoic acid export membrane protein
MPETPETNDESGLSRSELKHAALRGVRWVTIGRLVAETVAFAASVVVARLISPEEFGYAAVAAFVYALSQGLAAGSFGSPIVRANEVRTPQVQTAFALSLMTGVAVSAVVALAAPALGIWSSHTVHLVQLGGLCFAIFSVGAVSQALLQRELDFRRLAINEIVSLLPGTIVTVVAAAAGLGGLSLVLGFLVTALTSSIQALCWRPPGLPRVHRGEAGEIWRFGLPVSGSSLLYAAQRNVQLAILGARFDPMQLGFYWRGSQLGIDYQGKISGILMRIAFPILSRARTREDMRAVRSRMVRVHTTVLFPLLTCLIVLGPIIIPWLYGDRWAPAAQAAQILAVAGFVAVIGTGTGPLMMAVGRPNSLMVVNGMNLVLLSVAVYFAGPHGLVAVCFAVVGLRLVNLFVTQYFLVQRLAGIPLIETLVHDVMPAVVGSLALAAVAFGCSEGLQAIGAPAPIVIVVASAFGLGAHALAVRVVYPATWRDLATLAARVLPPLPLPKRRRLAEAGS